MDEHGPAINGLRSLIKARNALVHHKSESSVFNPKDPERTMAAMNSASRRMQAIFNQASASFQTLILLSLELNRILGTVAGSLPFFEHNANQQMAKMPKNILDLVRRCKQIDAKKSISD